MTTALELHPLFAGISSEACATLERHLQIRRFEAGDIILRAGVPSAELFGLIDGAVVAGAALAGRDVDVRIEMLPCRPLGLASWRSISDIRNITLEERA